MVTEYDKPITDPEILERAFWATASFRVKRVHEGRGATIRAGWQRVDVDAVEIAAPDARSGAQVLRTVERSALLEFAATLTDQERAVFACKYGESVKEQGRVVIARRLELPVADVRRAERAITQKLERFVAIVSAGSLCTHRGPAIEALAGGTASAQQELVARVHLDHCSVCRVEYTAQLRALRTGELQHRIAQLFPCPRWRRSGIVAGGVGGGHRLGLAPVHLRGATTGSQLAAGGRGIGTIATAKLAALCIGATAMGGGRTAPRCSSMNRGPSLPLRRRADQPPHRRKTGCLRRPGRDRRPGVGRAASSAAPRSHPTGGSPRDARRSQRASQRHVTSARRRSRRRRRSGAHVSEFDPAPSGTVTQAAAAPPSTGAPEFP